MYLLSRSLYAKMLLLLFFLAASMLTLANITNNSLVPLLNVDVVVCD